MDISPGRFSSEHLQQFQKAFCSAVVCYLWKIIYSAFPERKKEANFWSACRLWMWKIPVDVQKVTSRDKFCSIWGQHHQAAHQSKESQSKKILNNVFLVRCNGYFSNLFVICFFQEYALLHHHQCIYFHFSQILLVLNPITVSKYNRQICKASDSLAERACILSTELLISLNMSP